MAFVSAAECDRILCVRVCMHACTEKMVDSLKHLNVFLKKQLHLLSLISQPRKLHLACVTSRSYFCSLNVFNASRTCGVLLQPVQVWREATWFSP